MWQRKHAALTIICELKQWRLDATNRFVIGRVFDDCRKNPITNGTEFLFMNLKDPPLLHYPQGRDGPEYYLARRQLDEYILLLPDEGLIINALSMETPILEERGMASSQRTLI